MQLCSIWTTNSRIGRNIDDDTDKEVEHIHTHKTDTRNQTCKRRTNTQHEMKWRKKSSVDTPQNILIFHVHIRRLICDIESRCLFLLRLFQFTIFFSARYTSTQWLCVCVCCVSLYVVLELILYLGNCLKYLSNTLANQQMSIIILKLVICVLSSLHNLIHTNLLSSTCSNQQIISKRHKFFLRFLFFLSWNPLTRNTLLLYSVHFTLMVLFLWYESNGAKMQENEVKQKQNNYESTEKIKMDED